MKMTTKLLLLTLACLAASATFAQKSAVESIE
jgi:hypothetical protein